MSTNDPTTTDLSDFGDRERLELIKILHAWNAHDLPADFCHDGVQVMFNRNSGYVFLTNNQYETAMLNGLVLELWHNCPNCGHEGFEEDCQLNDEGCNECVKA